MDISPQKIVHGQQPREYCTWVRTQWYMGNSPENSSGHGAHQARSNVHGQPRDYCTLGAPSPKNYNTWATAQRNSVHGSQPDVTLCCNMSGVQTGPCNTVHGQQPRDIVYMDNCPDEVLMGCSRPMQEVYSGQQAHKATIKMQTEQTSKGQQAF